MSFFSLLSVNELGPLLHLVEESFSVRRHIDLLNWLQDEVQTFLRHDILISAWGDFSLGLICYDIVSPQADMRTENFSEQLILPFLTNLFLRWEHHDRQPYNLSSKDHYSVVSPPVNPANRQPVNIENALIHGIKDQRGRHDCLYILIGGDTLNEVRSHQALRFLLPYIDTVFRQVSHLPEQYYTELAGASEPLPVTPEPAPVVAKRHKFDIPTLLSEREIEVMHWVKLGKTNQEIGMILDISAFTVKNHLQRIFKKLNVMNRAQGVAMMENN